MSQPPDNSNPFGGAFPPQGGAWPAQPGASQPAWGPPPAQPVYPPTQAQPAYPPTQAQPAFPAAPFAPPMGAPTPEPFAQPGQAPVPFGAPRPFGAPSHEVGGVGGAQPPVPFGAPGWNPAQSPVPFGSTPYVAPPRSDGNPRVYGLVLIGLSALLGGVNFWSLTSDNKFYIQAMAITPMMFLAGIWLLIAGAPEDPRTGDMVTWARVGLGSSAVVGLILGIIACVFVGC